MEYLQNKKFGDLLTKFVLEKLTGQHEDYKRKDYPLLPSNEITIGVLFGEKVEDNEKELETIKDNQIFRSKSNSVKFLLKDLNNPPKIETKLSLFYRVIPNYKEQKKFIDNKDFYNENEYPMARIWKRYDVTFKKISFKSFEDNVKLNFEDVIEEIRKSNIVKSNFRIKKEVMESEEEYEKFINNKINENSYLRAKDDLKWDCEINITNEPFVQKDNELNLIEIKFINNTEDNTEEQVRSTITHEPSIFNPILNITLDEKIIPFYYTYEFEGKEKSYESYFRCNNCQAKINKTSNTITTKAYGEFNENKILPKSNIPNVDISFERMASEDNIGELNVISHKITEYYNKCSENNTDSLENLTNFLNMRNKFNKGIELLKENNIVNNAFKLMNKTFDEKSKNSDYHSWRLFQLVFIVSEIPDIVLEENREICDLLHVQTGGGKSEAYFGIVIFTIFFDRLRGKSFGVSAITKFPLRMLSVQQLQRIAELFIFAEKIRNEENINGEEFSIAYYVGSQEDEFPRHNRPIRRDISEAIKNEEEIPGKIIDKCPICGGNVILDIEDKTEVIIHRCKSCERIFKLYYSDDEVYRMLPTFIIATVDKFAGISMNRRVKNIFGGKVDKASCGHGFIPHNDTCEFEEGRRKQCKASGKEVKISFNTGPTLIIQDEMHLVREGFGTIDSHFETLTETLQEKMGGQKFKNIVMTATVSGAENQIKNLYNKELNIFPPTLKDSNGNDFFFEKLTDDNNNPIVQRKIIGLKPNSMNTRIMLHTIRYIAEFIIFAEKNLEKISKEHKIPSNELTNIISYYKTILTYHNKKENVHSTNFHLDDYVNKLIEYTVESRPLTGDNDLDYIKETITLVNEFNTKESLHAVHATNIVSHGVDIDRWNVMIFEGMPRSTAEYIQSLSRVGRKYYGIVFLTFDAKRTRDLSFFKHFNEYHDIIDYKVEPVPLARWAKLGIKQTITSIFCASILNYLSNELETPLYNTEQLRNVLIEEKNVNLLLDFINNAYVTYVGECDKETKENIDNEIKERIDYLMNYAGTEQNFFPNALKDCDDKYYRTQFGMRGIQDEIQLTPYNSDLSFRRNLKD